MHLHSTLSLAFAVSAITMALPLDYGEGELSKCYADAALSSDPNASMACETMEKRGVPEHDYDLSECLADAHDPYAIAACEKLSHSRKRDVDPELSRCLADAALSSDPNASKACKNLSHSKNRDQVDPELSECLAHAALSSDPNAPKACEHQKRSLDPDSDYDYRVCLAAAAESTDPRASEKCEEKYKNRGAQQQGKPIDHCSTQIAQARESIEYSCRLTDGAVGQGEL